MLTSCLEGSSNYVPSVSVSMFTNSNGDTIRAHYNNDQNFYYLDSVSVGDTIRFAVSFSSYANNLVSTNVIWDTTKLHLWSELPDDFLKVLTKESDIEALYFRYPEGYNWAAFRAEFVPLRSGDSQLTFAVESDAEKVENTYYSSVYVYTR